jgi:hypothetical protein
MTGSLGTTPSIHHQLDSASDSSAQACCTLASAPNPDYTCNSPPPLSHCAASFCTVNSKAPGGHCGSNSRLPPPTPALSPLHQVDFPGHSLSCVTLPMNVALSMQAAGMGSWLCKICNNNNQSLDLQCEMYPSCYLKHMQRHPIPASSVSSLHYITLHYITLHYITLHYITSHHITSHYITCSTQIKLVI